MATVATLEAVLSADTSRFKSGLSDAERSMNGLSTRAGSVMKGIGVAAVAGAAVAGAALAGVAVKGITEFAAFEKSMNEVFTLLPGMSEDAMGKMEDDVLALSNKMGVLPEETVPALYQALSAGVPADNVYTFLEDANKLAIGGVADLDASVGALTGVVNAYTDGSVTSAQAADLMFTTVKNGVTTIPELAASLGDVTPIAAALGIGFDEVSAAMATSTKVTQNTSKSATGLKTLLGELGKSGSTASKAFETMSGQSFPDFIASGGDLSGALKIMQKGADESGLSMIDMFGSIEAGQEALRLAADGSAEFDKQLGEMSKSAGASQEAFDQMDQGLARTWDKIKTTATTALIQVGKALAPFVETAVEWLAEKLPGAIDWLIGAFKKIAPVVAEIVGVIVAYWEWVGPKIMAAFEAIAPFVEDVFNTIRSVIETVTGWFKGDATKDVEDGVSKITDAFQDVYDFAKPLWDSIYALVKDAIELVKKIIDVTMQAVVGIWETHGDRIWQFIKSTFENIRDFISGILDAIRGVINIVMGLLTGDWERVWDGIKLFVSGIWEAIKGLVGQAIETVKLTVALALDAIKLAWDTVWGGILSFVGTIWDGIKSLVSTAVGLVVSTLATQWDSAVTKVHIVWDGIKSYIGGIWDTILGWVGEKWGAIRDGLAGIMNGISGVFSTGWANVKQFASDAVNFIIDMVNKAIGALNTLTVGVPDIPGIPSVGVTSGGGTRTNPVTRFTPGNTFIEGAAAGGIVRSPTLAMIGEGGEPEAIVPLSKASRYGFGSDGPSITVYVEGNLFGAATVDDLVEIIESGRRQHRLRGGVMV